MHQEQHKQMDSSNQMLDSSVLLVFSKLMEPISGSKKLVGRHFKNKEGCLQHIFNRDDYYRQLGCIIA